MFKLHSSLWWQDTGKAILAWVALAYLLLLITGLILWWPPSWRIVLDKGLLRHSSICTGWAARPWGW